mmetsp:Transcript_28990/g.69425  ORF Transcript_28990/g.69425 Transcript_28990/m.69425 type:complete len:461 (-) Transcript_28990:242-1624(-)
MGANSTKQLVTVEGKTYKKKKVLGEGRFGFVFLVKEKETKIRYAVKQIYTQDKEHLALAIQEAEMMKKVSPHPNIVRHVAHAIVPDARGGKTLYILTEYCSGGQLSDVIAARGGKAFPERQVLSIFSQVCRGVQQLHNARPHPIAHRDLKVENVVVHEDGSFKLCDLGSATPCGNRAFETAQERALLAEEIQKLTTVEYRAPEMADPWSGKGVSERSDLWALGCILFRLAFLQLPFPAGGHAQAQSGKFEFPPGSPYSPRLHHLVSALLRVDPDDRPDINTVVEILSNQSRAIPPAHTPDKTQAPAGAENGTPAQRRAVRADERTPEAAAAAGRGGGGGGVVEGARGHEAGEHRRKNTPPRQDKPHAGAEAGEQTQEGAGWVQFGDAEKDQGSSSSSSNNNSNSNNATPAAMRGLCAVCKDPVLAEQERTKGASGAYCHQQCFKGMPPGEQRAFALGRAS